METLNCTKCKETKPISDFSIRKERPNGKKYHSWCEGCRNKNTVKWRKNKKKESPETEKEMKEYQRYHNRKCHLKTTYGLNIEDYNRMFEQQDGKCAICGSKDTGNIKQKNLSVDHNHKTGQIRQLLCCNCNRTAGNIEMNLEIVDKIRLYLLRHSSDSYFENGAGI